MRMNATWTVSTGSGGGRLTSASRPDFMCASLGARQPGRRDPAEIHPQALPPESESVGQSFELAERVMVVPHSTGDLVRITHLDAAVKLPERVRDERLVEVAGDERLKAFLVVGLPGQARL